MPSGPSLVQDLTRLRLTRQEKDQQLCTLRNTVTTQRIASSYKRGISSLDDAVTKSTEAARAASQLAATEDRYQATALDLAIVELDIELVYWRDWLGKEAHDRDGCAVCVLAREERDDGGWPMRGESLGRRDARSPSPLKWEKRSESWGRKSRGDERMGSRRTKSGEQRKGSEKKWW
ncbi:MAG: hypothetical protein M1830_002568 [Pleopsidium flavum]|nr:MAG: hypothetical protein M1830_002568 [Pleopsidium flavum]